MVKNFTELASDKLAFKSKYGRYPSDNELIEFKNELDIKEDESLIKYAEECFYNGLYTNNDALGSAPRTGYKAFLKVWDEYHG